MPRKPKLTYADKPWLASYPPDVPADYDFPEVPLTRLLDDSAASFPTTIALAFLGNRITYRELKDQVDRFATALSNLGVKKGDRVAVVLPNCPQNVIAFFAALRLGAIVVEHNPLYTEAEMAHQLADCGAEVVICLDKVYETVAAVRAKTSVREIVVASVIEYLPAKERLLLQLPIAKARKVKAEISAPVPKGTKTFMKLLHSAKTQARQAPVDPRNDLALLQYTGGTTGLSKGAKLTHFNLVANAYQNRLWLPDVQAGREVTLAVLPLFHAYGLTVCMNVSVLLGGTLVLIPKFDLDAVFAAIDEYKPSLFPGVPPIYKAIVDSPEVRRHDLKSIKACVSGAMKLPLETQEQFEKVSGGKLVEGYGMTETSPSTHANPIFGKRKIGTIGMPLPGTECRIVSQDDATVEVPIGEPGELAIRGPQVFTGYWNRDEESAASFTEDGYVLTGDVARMDDEGYFEIVDRKKELIIAGGFNIYPSEVENVLFSLTGVADAVVAGIPDKYRGETVKAYVVRQPGSELTEDDVVKHCAKSLAAYKVPKIVEFRETLPRTVVGKVLRRVLLEEERAKAEAGTETTPGAEPTSAAKPPRKRPAAAKAATKPAKKTPPAARAAKKTPPAPAEPAAGEQTEPTEPAAAEAAAARKAPARKAAKPAAKAARKAAAKPPVVASEPPAEAAPAKPAKKAAAKKPAARKPAAKKPAKG